jgi:acyl-CoA reductase-like NAD-dependent aldehyde dehydrogenase
MCALDVPEEIIEDTAEKLVKTRYTPLGVAVGIVPWNCKLNTSQLDISSV